MTLKSPRLFCAAFTLLLTMPDAVLAQRPVSAQTPCENAARAASRARLAPNREESYRTLWMCPAANVRVLASLFAQLRTSTDTLALGWLAHESASWRDGTLFDAAMAVAADTGATAEARGFALHALDRMISPTHYHSVIVPGDDVRSGDVRGRSCEVVSLGHWEPRSGSTPLPGDVRERQRALNRQLARDVSAPPLVRRTAACMP